MPTTFPRYFLPWPSSLKVGVLPAIPVTLENVLEIGFRGEAVRKQRAGRLRGWVGKMGSVVGERLPED